MPTIILPTLHQATVAVLSAVIKTSR